MIGWINEACAAGARQSKACEVIGLSSRTLQRWRENGQVKTDGRGQPDSRSEPHNKLSPLERQHILDIANSQAFAHLSPNQIVPMLADQGRYIASESTFYRVLREADQLAHRGKAKGPTRKRPAPLQANAPNQLWSWDISVLQQRMA